MGPARLAEAPSVRQHWGMGRLGVGSSVRLRRHLVNGRIRTHLLTWIFSSSLQLWNKEASEGSGPFLEQGSFGAVGLQTGNKEEMNSRETGKKSQEPGAQNTSCGLVGAGNVLFPPQHCLPVV